MSGAGIRSEPIFMDELFDPVPYDEEERRLEALDLEVSTRLFELEDEQESEELELSWWERAEFIRECSSYKTAKLASRIYLHKQRAPGDLTVEGWRRIVAAWGNQCAYCCVSGDDESLHMDHVIPVAAGGRTDTRNIVPACKRCNTSKLNRDPEDWLGEEWFSFCAQRRAVTSLVEAES